VHSRANHSRTAAVVVALSLTAVSTIAAARAFRAAATQSQQTIEQTSTAAIDLDRTTKAE
jgi:type II secretory pathway component PulJ